MAKISTYPILSTPTVNDLLIGTDVENLNETKNFSIGDIGTLINQDYVPYVGATGNVNLGSFNITGGGFIVGGGTASQFLKADGSLDSTLYTPQTRTLTINGTTYNLSANRSWDLNTIDSLTTTGTSGAATYVGKVLNIPVYQAQGSYITQLSGEATGSGPGNATVTLDNTAVISKILTGLNVTGGTVVSTDTILQAFGKIQNQINGLAGGVEYQGVWNAATNTPFLQSSVGTQGHYYVVDVAGNTNLNGITDWQLGDWAIYNGSVWQKVDNTDAVVSVNGYVGAVVLTASDVGAVPTTRTLTINGVGYNLSADRAWTVGDVRTDGSYSNPSWITSLGWSKITGTPTTLAGYGITDGALNTTTLTINGTTYDLTANRSWSVGTVTSVGTSGPLTGGTIIGSGTIGITQSSSTTDGYLSASDWNAFNSKQGAISVNAPLTFVSGVIGITQSGASSDGYLSSTDWNTFNSKVSGSGTANTLPMWGSASSLINSPLSYAADAFNFQYNSSTGGTVNFTNIGLTTYTYSIQMNNFGSPRSTIHSYTDGLIIQSIGGTQVSRMFANGNLILGTGTVDNGYKLEVTGDLYVNTIANAATDTDRFIVSDGGLIKYRTGAQVLSDIGAQGVLTLTTTGSSGPATLIGDTLNIPNYSSSLTGYVPYTGATQNVNLGEYGLTGGYFLLDTTPTGTPTSQGTIYWDDSKSTAALIMNGTIQHIGQDTYFYVKNSTGSSIPKGTAVRFAGTDGASGHLLIAPFLADGTYPSSYFMGVTSETIANGSFGQVSNFGELSGIDTSAYTAGDLLYASTTVAGGFQTTPPVAPNNIVLVSAAVNSNNNGSIVVRPTLGSNFGTNESVKLTSVANLDLLQYQSGTGVWENKTIDGAGIVTKATTQTITGAKTFNSLSLILAANGTSNQTIFSNSSASQTSMAGINFFGFNQFNDIYFNKGTSLNAGFFQFNNTAARTYTLPDATGTIALVGGAGVGTVTSVAALTLGTSGTDLSSTVANSTTTPVITLNIPTASATNRGALSAADWTTFNNKQASGNYITSLTGEVTASGPGAAAATLNNASVTSKILTGVNITGGSISATDSMLTAFGKLQNQINSLIGGSIYQGTWDASTNTPTLTSSVGTNGYYYIVNVAGSTNLNGITDWKVGDWAIFHGGTWQKVDNTDAVTSVNGQIGAVSLNTDNIPEGSTNQYYLNSRARAALSFAAGSGAYNTSTGVITIPTNTNQLTNGAAFITLGSLSGTSPISYNSGTGAISIQQATSTQNGFLSSTDWTTFNNKQANIAAGTTAQYYRGDKTFQTLNTAAVPESGNLYYTNARAIASTLTGYVSGAGTISSADSILSAIQKLNGNIGSLTTGVSSVFGRTGAVVAANGDYYLGTTAIQAASANQAITGITGITFVAQSTDAASITTTISSTSTFFDFNLSDDNLNDEWRWRFTPSGASVYDAMRLVPTTNTTSNLIVSGNIVKSGGTSSQFLKADGSVDSNTYLTGNQTITLSGDATGSGTTAITVTLANSGVTAGTYNNVATQVRPFTVDAKGRITSIGTAVTITPAFSNITGKPTTLAGYGITDAVPSNRTITINGVTQDLSLNRTYDVGTVTSVGLSSTTSGVTIGSTPVTSSGTITLEIATASGLQNGLLSSTDWTTFNGKQDNIVAGTTAQYYRGDKTFQTLNTAAVPELTNLYYTEARVSANTDVAANTAARHAAVTLGTANGLGLTGQELSLGLASSSANGALSSTDWTTFNNKQNALTNPVTGTGTTNYLPKFTGTSTIGNSIFTENAGNGLRIIAADANIRLDGSREYLLQTVDADGRFRIYDQTAALERVTLTSTGNVGIGTTAPLGKIHSWQGSSGQSSANSVANGFIVEDNQSQGISILTPSTNEGNIFFGDESDNFIGGIRYFHTDDSLTFTANNVERMRITSSGNVGINENNPVSKLQITSTLNSTGYTSAENLSGATNLNLYQILNGNTSTDNNGESGILISQTLSNAAQWGISVKRTNSFVGDLIFRTRTASTTSAERMRITSAGNVGIGTTAPAFAVGSGLEIERDSATATLRLQRTGTNTSNLEIRAGESVAEFVVTSGSTPLLFSTGGSERWQITSTGILQSNGAQTIQASTGNLTLATAAGNGDIVLTPNGTGIALIQNSVVGNIARFLSNTANGQQLTILSTATGVQIRSAFSTGIAGSFEIFASGGSSTLSFGTASVERMRIFNDGNVLIQSGGTFTNNGARLQVSGTATVSGIGYFGGSASLVTSTGILTSSSILQIFNGGGAGSNIDKISDVILANNSSYTDGSIGRLIGVNTAITTADKRIAQIAFVNNGAINSGQISFATLDAGTFSTKMILTSTGNVLIGTTTDTGSRLGIKSSGTNSFPLIVQRSANTNTLAAISETSGGDGTFLLANSLGSTNIQLLSNGTSILNGGNVLIGTTTDAGYTLNVAGNAQIIKSGTSTALVAGLSGVTGSIIRFSYNGGFVGSISTDGSNTAYNTSSDYRLKQDIKDFNGLALLSRIKPYDFEWKSDKTRSYGVLAHELQEVINYAVTGSKDAEEMQGVDYSKLVPILIKAIQELNEKIK